LFWEQLCICCLAYRQAGFDVGPIYFL